MALQQSLLTRASRAWPLGGRADVEFAGRGGDDGVTGGPPDLQVQHSLPDGLHPLVSLLPALEGQEDFRARVPQLQGVGPPYGQPGGWLYHCILREGGKREPR